MRQLPSTTWISAPSWMPWMEHSFVRPSSVVPPSWREKHVRWQVISCSISTWCSSDTNSCPDTWQWRRDRIHGFRKRWRYSDSEKLMTVIKPNLKLKTFCSRRLNFDSKAVILEINYIMDAKMLAFINISQLTGAVLTAFFNLTRRSWQNRRDKTRLSVWILAVWCVGQFFSVFKLKGQM